MYICLSVYKIIMNMLMHIVIKNNFFLFYVLISCVETELFYILYAYCIFSYINFII